MTVLHLPTNFAIQSATTDHLVVSQRLDHDGTVSALVEAATYPRSGVIHIEGLKPDRHYVLRGIDQRFSRTSAHGTAMLELTLTGPTLLLLSPVI